MDWAIRKAGEDDADRLALIGAATFLETFAGVLDGDAIVAHCAAEHTPAAYRTYLAAGAHAWLAEIAPGRAPVGFALLAAPSLPGSTAGDLELKRIYASSRCHGLGVGAALMAAVVAHARAVHGSRLLLGVYAGNDRARAFYTKNGFERIADRRFQVGDRHYDDVVLAKTLAKGD
jgi:GNAT superfamily N-acetyltransferase